MPPSAPEYPEFAADIQRRAANPVPGSPPPMPFPEGPAEPAMVLLNRSQTGIAAISWIWKFEPETGRVIPWSNLLGQLPPALAPFGLDDRSRKLHGYWHVILPGSKRLIRAFRMIGDNTDVRPPQADEMWSGGGFGFGSGSRSIPGALRSIALALDGVLFMDGSFAGPDTLRTFDRLTAEANAHLEVARIARAGHDQGLTPADILKRIEIVTGPDRGPGPPPPPDATKSDFRGDHMRRLASRIAAMRRGMADDGVVYQLMSWTETPLPNFHKL